MYQISDYQCENKECNQVHEFLKKSIKEDFPSTKICPTCGGTCYRVYSPVLFDVALGKLGNAKSGYDNELIYHPSKFT